MGRFVIVAYMPRPGQADTLRKLIDRHLDVLRQQSLVTDRAAYVMRAGNGTFVEVFEWRSAEAIEQAHADAAVQALWSEFDAACTYVPLSSLSEVSQLFAEFEAV